MVERPLPLGNGYIWFAHTLVSAEKAQCLEQQLSAVRHHLQTRNQSLFGDSGHNTEIELWVHPDDKGPAWGILQKLLLTA